MDYSVDCPCGKRINVTASAAGATVSCSCGRAVPVPRLSALRQAVGKGAFEAGSVDLVRRLLAEGKLPLAKVCALTGRPTEEVAELRIECERVWKRGRGKGRWYIAVFSVLFLPFWPVWWLLCWALADEKSEELGCDTIVQVPLRVCVDQQARLRRMSQRKLRRLLRDEWAYAQLLEEYPDSRISVCPAPISITPSA